MVLENGQVCINATWLIGWLHRRAPRLKLIPRLKHTWFTVWIAPCEVMDWTRRRTFYSDGLYESWHLMQTWDARKWLQLQWHPLTLLTGFISVTSLKWWMHPHRQGSGCNEPLICDHEALRSLCASKKAVFTQTLMKLTYFIYLDIALNGLISVIDCIKQHLFSFNGCSSICYGVNHVAVST